MEGGRIIRNFDEIALSEARRDALIIVEAGLSAINTRRVLMDALKLEGDTLSVRGEKCQTEHPERIFFVGIGKCAVDAAIAIEEILGSRLSGGIALDVFVPEEKKAQLKTIKHFEGTHPLPSQANVDATKHILELLESLTERDVVIVLVSGGGSTLLCYPEGNMTPEDEAKIFKTMTANGAAIQDLNAVRKHLSSARGGGLARAAYPAEVVGLIISDVPGNSIEFIASGPTVRDDTTLESARATLVHFGLKEDCCTLIETPKEEKYFTRVHNVMLADNVRALSGMEEKARELGYSVKIMTSEMTGEAKDVGARILEELHAAPEKSVHLYGGETTVTLGKGGGDGGRNQEMAIAMLPSVREGEVIIPFASDGRDNSDGAAGVCDTLTVSHAESAAVAIDEHLNAHLSYTFFKKTGDLVMTGETGSNVSDLIVALKK